LASHWAAAQTWSSGEVLFPAGHVRPFSQDGFETILRKHAYVIGDLGNGPDLSGVM
jgi:hypothetical protein